MSVGEPKSGDFKDVCELLVERAVLLFRSQNSRRFVLTFVLVNGEVINDWDFSISMGWLNRH